MRSNFSPPTAFTPAAAFPSPPSRGLSRCRIPSPARSPSACPCRQRHGGIVDRQDFIARLETVRPPSWRAPSAAARKYQVMDTHIGEGAAHHHLVVAAAPLYIAVEIARRHAQLLQVATGRRIRLERPAGLMWSVVTESPNSASAGADNVGACPGCMLKPAKNGGSAM